MKTIRALIQIAMKNDNFSREAYPFKDYRIKHIDPVLTSRDYLEPEDVYKVGQLWSPEKKLILLLWVKLKQQNGFYLHVIPN